MKSIVMLLTVLAVFLTPVICSAQSQTQNRMSYTGEWIGDPPKKNVSDAQVLEGYSKEGSSRREYAGRGPDVSSVRTNEIVKVYGVGRYVDPADCRIMHERHPVYRLEERSGWRLQAPANQPAILMGPIVGLRRPEYAPEPLPGEVGRDLITTRRNVQEALEGVRRVTEDQVKVRQDLDQNLKRINQNEETLIKELNELRQRSSAVENKPQNFNNERNQPKQPPTTNGVTPSNQ